MYLRRCVFQLNWSQPPPPPPALIHPLYDHREIHVTRHTYQYKSHNYRAVRYPWICVSESKKKYITQVMQKSVRAIAIQGIASTTPAMHHAAALAQQAICQ